MYIKNLLVLTTLCSALNLPLLSMETKTTEPKLHAEIHAMPYSETQCHILHSSRNIIFLPIVYLFYPHYNHETGAMGRIANNFNSFLISSLTVPQEIAHFTITRGNLLVLTTEGLNVKTTEKFIQNFNEKHNYTHRDFANPTFIKDLHLTFDELPFDINNAPALYRNGVLYTGENKTSDVIEAFLEYFNGHMPHQTTVTLVSPHQEEIKETHKIAHQFNLHFNGFMITNP